MNYRNFAYATLNLSFDRDRFIDEYDQRIWPVSQPFVSIQTAWTRTKQLNDYWQIVPTALLDQYELKVSQVDNTTVVSDTAQWDMIQLMYVDGAEPPEVSGSGWRNTHLDHEWKLKPQFADLAIIDWIHNNIPMKKIVGIHCVSIEPGGFSNIHRDVYWLNSGINPAANNGVYRKGFVVVTLNISNGGVPLLWSLDGDDVYRPRGEDSDCYMISDYFYHAVPVTQSRRRQIRITGIPDDAFHDCIKPGTEIILPDNYRFDNI